MRKNISIHRDIDIYFAGTGASCHHTLNKSTTVVGNTKKWILMISKNCLSDPLQKKGIIFQENHRFFKHKSKVFLSYVGETILSNLI